MNTTIGWAAKVGADVRITDSVYWNIDAMYYDCRPDMTYCWHRNTNSTSTPSSSAPVLGFVSK